ncbi:Do/DeqQ family serine protease [Flavobacteriaceae bacterium MAR_2010_72]|nr:Do/DeqQ family serine protease [Flavobacteriaceae bacterium MAR_2010_72]TVZ59401.1 Do/DeqQ family serine protease [Flavobacteriaceae bacterium MAR_2010_105]
MKKILTLVFVSVLGGIIALSAYKFFVQPETVIATNTQNTSPFFIPTSNYDAKTTNLLNTESPNFIKAADKTIHSVVHVKNTAVISGPVTFEDLFFGRKSQRAQIGTGSGVIISPDGYIITNNHVINGAKEIAITLNDNRIYDAELIGSDEKTDIALLKIKADDDLPYIAFGDSDQAQIGEWVLAVGNPFNLTSTVTAGIISAKSRDLSGRNSQSFIQTDAAVNPGNSGGALVNVNGDLIGINTAITSQTGSYIGYSFAVPSNIARKVVEDIMEYGDVQTGILGVTGGTLNSKAAEEVGVKDTEGFYISSVEEDSGAEKAGIQSGDVIKRIDNVEISKFSDLSGYLSTKRPNDVVNVTIVRDHKTKTLPVTLVKNLTVDLPILGRVKDAKTADLRKFKVKNGVKIAQLDGRYASNWKANGIEEGCILTAINGVPINSIEEAKRVIENKTADEPLKFEIINKNGEKENFYWR